jgi:selenide, water dikinase
MQTERRLTSFSHGAGCGCKLGPDQLNEVLGTLTLPGVPPEVLVATETGDDAAVYALDDGRALVATLDFFTPIVDDPYDWGRIAATNAMSDVYAMGGTPFLGLNIVSWPIDDLPAEMLGRVLQGGVDAAGAVGVPVLGGHSITDPEPKYGMVVLGFVDQRRMLRNSTAVAGDALVLTKPLGLGMISTAVKRGVASDEMIATAVDLMTTPNRAASEAVNEVGADAATDVTGFGLLGHLHRMLVASGVAAQIDASTIPVIDGALDLARGGVVPGGTQRNHASVAPHVDWAQLTEPEQLLLADAQTSGGLLVATREPDALLDAFAARGVAGAKIGTILEGRDGAVSVTGRLSE